MASTWALEFGGGFYIFGKYLDPCSLYLISCISPKFHLHSLDKIVGMPSPLQEKSISVCFCFVLLEILARTMSVFESAGSLYSV